MRIWFTHNQQRFVVTMIDGAVMWRSEMSDRVGRSWRNVNDTARDRLVNIEFRRALIRAERKLLEKA